MNILNLHLGIIQRITFVLLKISRRIQSWVSFLYWRILCNPLLWLGWKAWGEKNNQIRTINFYQEKKLSYTYGKILYSALKVNSWLNGLRNPYSSYEFLLTWNPSIPLIALKKVKTTYQIYQLGKESREQKGAYPLIDGSVISTSDVCGHFMITNKECKGESPERVDIECIWLSGEQKGQKFNIGHLGFSLEKKGQIIPDSIYFPPNAIIWIFEILLSISAVAVLIGVCVQVYKYIHPYLEKILHSLELASLLTSI